ncbi:MAG: hypothetical protein CV045_07370 [Cyanobacteria bacterium M5B4]|nr:MAG: hypothetical protein CV045_07370 [Cyanobacteria bacterium M5B4]
MTAVNTFVQNKPILFGATLLDVPNSTTIYASDILFDGKGKKVAPAGLFVAKGQEGIGILKRTRLAKKLLLLQPML